MKFSPFLFSLGLLFMTGCKVGPDYHPPNPPMPQSFTEDRGEETFSISDEDLVGWWNIFNDPFLDALLEQAICGSFDYRIALEKVYQAKYQYWVQYTQLLPEFIADGQGSRYRASQSFATQVPGKTPFHDFFQIGLDAIWEIDLFGKLRRSADASCDLWQATDEEARAVKITVLSQVATTYVTICAFQKKIENQEQFIAFDKDIIDLTRTKYEAGLASEQEIEALVATYESDIAATLLLRTGLRQSIYSLGILLGKNPEDLLGDFQVTRPILDPVGMIVPAGMPADLLRRRPDINAAERQLAAATEQIGVAVAALYPSVSLAGSSSSFASNPLQGANVGYASDKIQNLLKPASLVWGVGTFIQWPILDFGQRIATIKVETSLAKEQYLNYQKTVVTALQEVENALIAYFNDEDRVFALKKQVNASKKSLDLVEDLFEAGLADYLQLLQTRQIWVTALNTLVDSQQAIAIDLINVYKSMGGDW